MVKRGVKEKEQKEFKTALYPVGHARHRLTEMLDGTLDLVDSVYPVNTYCTVALRDP